MQRTSILAHCPQEQGREALKFCLKMCNSLLGRRDVVSVHAFMFINVADIITHLRACGKRNPKGETMIKKQNTRGLAGPNLRPPRPPRASAVSRPRSFPMEAAGKKLSLPPRTA